MRGRGSEDVNHAERGREEERRMREREREREREEEINYVFNYCLE